MYSIGMFSQINRITCKTLRYYDEIGLLKPCHIDGMTGYRYYSSDQLPRMNKILALKQMGFSLTEMIAMLDSDCSGETMTNLLLLKQKEISGNIAEEQQKLKLIENFLSNEKGDFMTNYTATIKELPEVTVASHRQMIPDYNALFSLSTDMIVPEMNRLGCIRTKPEYCFNIYHYDEFKDHDIDVEVCEAVTEKKSDTDKLNFKVFPKVATAVSVLHQGSYSNLQEAYAFGLTWIEQNGYKLIDHPRESFIDGIWNKKEETDWLTELQFPVEKV